MRFRTKGAALAALLLASCAGAGAGYGVVGFGLGLGFAWWEDYYDDYDDYHDCDHCATVTHASWAPAAVSGADLDADGNVDAVVCDQADGRVWLARGARPGRFAVETAPRDLALGAGTDVFVMRADADGNPDLLVFDALTGTIATWRGDGVGGFTSMAPSGDLPAGSRTARLACASVDGDAFDDLVTIDDRGDVHVLLGTGAGAFSERRGAVDPSAFLGPDAAARVDRLFVALAPFDLSPGVDLLLVDGMRAQLAVFSGNGDGTFGAPQTTILRGVGDVLALAPVFLSTPGVADIAVLTGSRVDSGLPSSLTVLRPVDGETVVEPMEAGRARALHAIDLDHDGLSDLLVADAAAHSLRALRAVRR